MAGFLGADLVAAGWKARLRSNDCASDMMGSDVAPGLELRQESKFGAEDLGMAPDSPADSHLATSG